MSESNENLGKKAMKAGTAYVISNIAVKAAFAITTPIFVRMMTKTEYGTVSMFTSWSTLLYPFFSLQLATSIGRAKIDYPDRLDDYMGSMQLFSAVVSFLWVAFSVIFIGPVSGWLELTEVETILLMAYMFFSPAITFRQGVLRYRYQVKQNIFIAWYTILGTLVLSFVLMYFLKGDMALYRCIGIAVPPILLSVVLWAREIRNGTLRYNKEFWKYGWMISGPLILHQLSLYVLSQSDRIIITKICGKEDAGTYSLAYTIGVLLAVITNSISEAWLPWFHETYHAGDYGAIRKNVKPLVVLCCYIGLATVAFAPELVLIFGGKKYMTGVTCVAPVAVGIVCRYIYTHYVNVELHLKKTKYVSMGTILAALVNVALNFIFVPMYGYVAAAYTTLASYMLLMVVHFLITKYILKVDIYDNLFLYGSAFVVIILSVLLLFTYDYTLLRYGIIAVGFASFLFVFRTRMKTGLAMLKKRMKK